MSVDREQTHKSLAICLVEEASEVLEAIDSENVESMEEELGDLLLQVVFHACLAEENAQFDLEDVARGINEKLIRRHPHVFGGEEERLQTSDEVIDRWELIKASEKKDGEVNLHGKFLKIYLHNYPPCSLHDRFSSRPKKGIGGMG